MMTHKITKKPMAIVYTPRKAANWKSEIQRQMVAQKVPRLLLKVPVVITLRFLIADPGGKHAKKRSGPCFMDTKGDGDNLEKSVLDAICDTRGKGLGYGLIHDDRFVVGMTWTKEWCEAGSEGVNIKVEWDDESVIKA